MFGCRFPWLLAVFSVALWAGCSSTPARLTGPSLSPTAIAAQAIEQYDANHDGTIEGAELDKVPALKNSLAKLDKNGDQKISAEEIAAEVQNWKDNKYPVLQFTCAVTLDGKPLSNATVTLVPEKFMGADAKPAQGLTNMEGQARLGTEGLERNGVNLVGVYCGFYKVEISKKEGGAELVPARYNTQTELGQEVGLDEPRLTEGLTFDLHSK